jgi:hypothetical protein
VNRRRARASRRRHSASTPAASSPRSGRSTTTLPSRSVSSQTGALPAVTTRPKAARGPATPSPAPPGPPIPRRMPDAARASPAPERRATGWRQRLPGRAWHRLPQHPILPARGVDHDHHPVWTLIAMAPPNLRRRRGRVPCRADPLKASNPAGWPTRDERAPGQAASRPVTGQRRRTADARHHVRDEPSGTPGTGEIAVADQHACCGSRPRSWCTWSRSSGSASRRPSPRRRCWSDVPVGPAGGRRWPLPVLVRIEARPSARSRRRYHGMAAMT